MAKTLAEKIAVMVAFQAGEKIETCRRAARRQVPEDWVPAPVEPYWNWGHSDYRVKPQPPRDIWVNEYEKGFGLAHPTEAVALFVAAQSAPVLKRTAIHFREVIGE